MAHQTSTILQKQSTPSLTGGLVDANFRQLATVAQFAMPGRFKRHQTKAHGLHRQRYGQRRFNPELLGVWGRCRSSSPMGGRRYGRVLRGS
jgi:hypothetical protein